MKGGENEGTEWFCPENRLIEKEKEDMSIVKKQKEVKTGMENLMNHMIEDYNGWSMRCRTVESDAKEFIRVTEIRERMEKEYADKLGYEVKNKYIKVSSGGSVCCFVVITDSDKKFRFGDILKPAGWAGPTKNFARGNILENDFRGLSWTGC
jgi:hypothetical protein